LVQSQQDRLDDPISVRQNIVVPEAQNEPALLFEKRCAAFVSGAVHVLTAVRFNNKAMPRAGKIDDERIDRILAPKPATGQAPIPQRSPEPALGVSGDLA